VTNGVTAANNKQSIVDGTKIYIPLFFSLLSAVRCYEAAHPDSESPPQAQQWHCASNLAQVLCLSENRVPLSQFIATHIPVMDQQSGWQASLAALPQQLPLLQSLPDNTAATAALGAVLVLLLIPRLRILIWNTVETVLASLLLVLLVLVVLGLAPGELCSTLP
jgi:hypothetical protein